MMEDRNPLPDRESAQADSHSAKGSAEAEEAKDSVPQVAAASTPFDRPRLDKLPLSREREEKGFLLERDD